MEIPDDLAVCKWKRWERGVNLWFADNKLTQERSRRETSDAQNLCRVRSLPPSLYLTKRSRKPGRRELCVKPNWTNLKIGGLILTWKFSRIRLGVTLLGMTTICCCIKCRSRTWAGVFEWVLAISKTRGLSKTSGIGGGLVNVTIETMLNV